MSPKKILVVDDEKETADILVKKLQQNKYTAQAAYSGQECLDACRSDKPDLVVLDIVMPLINGYEVCRLIRQENLNMPIIMLTAKGEESDIILGLNLGADDYVTKPFSIKELLARAAAFLRRSRQTDQDVHEFGDYRLDIPARKFTRGAEEIKLSPKEFKLLELFLKKPGRALTRDEILNAVWGYDCYVGPRTIDRFVTTLRNKIEPDPHDPTFIHTIREIGYKFEPPE